MRRPSVVETPTFPRSIATFNLTQQRLLNRVDRNKEADTLATTFVVKHGSADLLAMLGLTNG